jgi:hypothetical protein
MPTSRDLKKKHRVLVNATGIGRVVVLLVASAGGLVGCQTRPYPMCDVGDEVCVCEYLVDCDGGRPADARATAHADEDDPVGSGGIPKCTLWPDLDQLETQFIVPSCGKPATPGQDPATVPACHNGAFVPALDHAGLLEDNLKHPSAAVTQKRLTCKGDPWIDTEDWTRSYVITKTNVATSGAKNAIRCLSNGANGMARMPSATDSNPSVVLRQEEYDCIRYFVYKLAGN